MNKEKDSYKRCMWMLLGISCLLVVILVAVIASEADAQTKVIPDPESDMVTFKVIPGANGAEVVITIDDIRTTYKIEPSGSVLPVKREVIHG